MQTTSATPKTIKPVKLPYATTTDLFKDRKNVPAFVMTHKIFKTPHKIGKIFPSVGLANFKEECDLAKPLIDLKKENFISSLIQAMVNALVSAKDEAMNFGDRIQFLLTGEERTNQMGKINDVYSLGVLIKNLLPQLDNYNNAYERVVQTSEGKIVLRLAEDVLDKNGKLVFKKNESLFKVFAKLLEKFTANNLTFVDLQQTNEFKVFSAENVPNKKYQVVFSSEGSEGAWDILTMSMRGIKSCQRWDGDYPRCLIGSIVSKYVGIIYITSGAETEFTCNMQEGTLVGKGLKMMRRALVRYAIDADEGKPCILVDRIYPVPAAGQDYDEETMKVFVNALKGKTSLPVHFSPQLGAKLKHFYVPFEKIREEMQERDWTYQDTPLKTNLDFQLHVLASSSNDDVSRYLSCFKTQLVMHMNETFRSILNNKVRVAEEISRTMHNIKLNGQVDKFNEKMVETILGRFTFNSPKSIHDPKECYRKCLLKLALQLKTIRATQQAVINAYIDAATSRSVDYKVFCDFVCQKLILDCIKQELKNISKS